MQILPAQGQAPQRGEAAASAADVAAEQAAAQQHTQELPRIRLIVHATDGSPASWSAAAEAVALAQQTGARLVALFVVNTQEAGRLGALAQPASDAMREQGQGAVGRVVELARQHGVQAQGMLVDGHPGQAIVSTASSLHADLIVVGSHGASGLERMLLGSVSEFVVRHAGGPVLVVRARG